MKETIVRDDLRKELPTYEPDFEEYIRQGEPEKKERAMIWMTAIGLQQVDGLQVSDYLKRLAIRNIEGELSFDDIKRLITKYYKEKRHKSDVTQNVTQNITARQREILRLIQIEKSISAAKMAERLGVTIRSIRRDFDALRKIYHIEWIGASKGGHWEVQSGKVNI